MRQIITKDDGEPRDTTLRWRAMKSSASFSMTIDGVGAASAGTIDVYDPATGSVLHQAPDCSVIQVEKAVARAQRTQRDWQGLPGNARRLQLVALCQAVEAAFESLKSLLCSEGGKLERHANDELRTALHRAQLSLGSSLPRAAHLRSDGIDVRMTHQPLGVLVLRAHCHDPVGSVFPQTIQALLAGNTVIVVAAPTAPLTMLRLGELSRGLLRAGAFNVVSGGEALGPMLAGHPGVSRYALPRPAAIRRASAVVLADADDLAEAVAVRLFRHAFESGGAHGTALRFVYVHRDIHARSANVWANLAKGARLGGAGEPGNDIGPLQNRQLHEHAVRYFSDARIRDLHFLAGGHVASRAGFFVPPAVVDDPPLEACGLIDVAPCALVALLKYSDLDEVLAQTDAHVPDVVSIWSNDLRSAHRLADRLRSQVVLVNQVAAPHHTQAAPRENGLLAYMRTRVRVVRSNLS